MENSQSSPTVSMQISEVMTPLMERTPVFYKRKRKFTEEEKQAIKELKNYLRSIHRDSINIAQELDRIIYCDKKGNRRQLDEKFVSVVLVFLGLFLLGYMMAEGIEDYNHFSR